MPSQTRDRHCRRRDHVVLAVLWITTVAGLLLIWLQRGSHAGVQENLRVRRISVVDERGTQRVLLSAPLPEPIVNGHVGHRDSPVSGILIYDPKGNERGGYVTSDGPDLGALISLDSEKEQVFTAYANAGSGATVWVSNENRDNVVMSTHNTPHRKHLAESLIRTFERGRRRTPRCRSVGPRRSIYCTVTLMFVEWAINPDVALRVTMNVCGGFCFPPEF
jgi:hypothetical protein